MQVSDLHQIYYELCGNPGGKPVMVLHGGPGGGSYPVLRRHHDSAKYLIVLHDQRGAGKSKPYCELSENNTPSLVEDIERLRKHLDLGKVQIFGGSWGSTLGLAYAEAYPDNVRSLVLRGVFTATGAEIDHFYHGGLTKRFPEAFERLQAILPHPEKLNYPAQLLGLLQSEEPGMRRQAATEWPSYEMKTAVLERTDVEVQRLLQGWDPYDFSLIENYYMANACFLKEGQLLQEASKMRSIPTVIVQGRYDVICPPVTAYRLHQALSKSRLIIVEGSGHSSGEPRMRSALIEAVKSTRISQMECS